MRRVDRTLVVYVYNAFDTEHQRNFAFFLRYGIDERGASYRIIVSHGPSIKEFPRLPKLPSNADYLHTNACTHSWGAIRSVMTELPTVSYDYFVVLDSSVRGPYLPPYVANHDGFHWTEAFTNKLDTEVKLVGSLINCEGAPLNGNAAGPWRGNPAVSPNAWATDAVGWRILTESKEIFKCHFSPWDVKYFSEYGSSLAILNAGYTLDSLLTRYQGVDWGLPSSWQCNRRVRPDFEYHYDGISITPYETIFIPMSSASIYTRWSFVDAAERYERWMDRQLRPMEARPGVHTNQWITKNWAFKAEKLVYMNTRGPECFDFDYYLKVCAAGIRYLLLSITSLPFSTCPLVFLS